MLSEARRSQRTFRWKQMGTLSIGKQGELTKDFDTGPAAQENGVDGILRTNSGFPIYGLVPTSRWSSGSATSFVSGYAKTLSQPRNTQQPKNFDGNGRPQDGSQVDFDFCAQQAFRAYRKKYLRTSGQAIVGGIGIGLGASVGIGIRGVGLGVRGAAHAAKDLELGGLGRMLAVYMELKDGSTIAAIASFFGGAFAHKAINEAYQNDNRLEAALQHCKSRFPECEPHV